jgi:hypothetical protein
MATLSEALRARGNATTRYGARTFTVQGNDKHGYTLSIAYGDMRPYHYLNFKTFAELERYQRVIIPPRFLDNWKAY